MTQTRCLSDRFPVLGLLLALTLLASACTTPPAPTPAEPTVYLFSYFIKNGEDGLHLATSRDGLTWTPLRDGKPFLTPAVGGKLMRDPCLLRGPDGVFHLVWTTGWSGEGGKGFGVAHSRDLVTWSEQQNVIVMDHEPTARNVWAPDLAYDEKTGEYLILWSTTIPGRFPQTDTTGDDRLNHRIYCTRTRDFRTYTPAELFYDGGFNVIDATLTRLGDEYLLIVKDETRHPPKKNLRVARSQSIRGPYGPAGPPFTPDWVEGPSVVKSGDSWVVYYDEYTRGRYGAVRTKDFQTWETITEQLHFPKGARHGTVLRVPEAVVAGLK